MPLIPVSFPISPKGNHKKGWCTKCHLASATVTFYVKILSTYINFFLYTLRFIFQYLLELFHLLGVGFQMFYCFVLVFSRILSKSKKNISLDTYLLPSIWTWDFVIFVVNIINGNCHFFQCQMEIEYIEIFLNE